MFVATNICRGKCFVTAKICLSFCVCQKNKKTKTFCRDKYTFVATKMILVATPASDMIGLSRSSNSKWKPAMAKT